MVTLARKGIGLPAHDSHIILILHFFVARVVVDWPEVVHETDGRVVCKPVCDHPAPGPGLGLVVKTVGLKHAQQR